MAKSYKLLVLAMLFITSAMFAQKYTVSGTVTNADNGEKLIGANVVVKGTYIGAATDESGKYSFKVDAGKYTIVCSYIGFETKEVTVDVTKNVEVNFQLRDKQFSLNVTVLADRAKEQETPVAFSTVEKKDMELKLGSQDIPMVLNTTPSVYATQQGGGAGDARINVRGFNQRNVAVMINGVPVNDMENGWVYWSNWDGLGDATSSIQLQRGLTAVNLATPSIGGTLNIITDPTAHDMGFSFKQEFGSGSFLKSSLYGHTGLVDNKWAMTLGIVRKVGDGVIDKTWTDAWAYYFGASYNINENNRLELYAVGAPQRHGQNLYKQNIAAYSHDYVKDLVDMPDSMWDAYFERFPEKGRNYNQNWNYVDPSYKGKQYWYGSSSDRHDPNFINERENYYHKPQVNLNWYSNLSQKVSLYTTLYYSGGTGGGSGTYGSLKWDYSGPSRIADWNGTIAQNSANYDSTVGGNVSLGILRNSVNNQWTVGLLAKAIYKMNDELRMTFGIDGRVAEIEHYREVRDLLGGDYYYYDGNEFESGTQYYKKLGDKIVYYNTNDVNWFGAYWQTEYSTPIFTTYATLAWSTIKYKYTDHFHKDDNGDELVLDPDSYNGYQIKAGASYRFTPEVSAFANVGYVEKVPIFDAVIDDYHGVYTDNPENEKFLSFEAGVNYTVKTLTMKLNGYYTSWKDRAQSKFVQVTDSTYGLVFLTGMNSVHMGIEAEIAWQPIRMFRFDGAFSFGDWTYTNDVSGTYKTYDTGTGRDTAIVYDYYVDGLKVGDAPQTQMAFSFSFYPIKGMTLQAVYRYNANFYADWDPFSRTDPNDRTQSWEVPDYGLLDLHFKYNLPYELAGMRFQVFAHVFNVLDELYVSDAVDESHYNAWSEGEPHSATRAEVFVGMERTWNAGFSIRL